MKVYTSIALRSDCKRLAPDDLSGARGICCRIPGSDRRAVCLPVDSFVAGSGFDARVKKGCFDSYPGSCPEKESANSTHMLRRTPNLNNPVAVEFLLVYDEEKLLTTLTKTAAKDWF